MILEGWEMRVPWKKSQGEPNENPQRIQNVPYQTVTKDSTQIKNVSDCRYTNNTKIPNLNDSLHPYIPT